MTADDLAELLRKWVEQENGAAYPAVHLFGIEFADALKGHNLSAIATTAGLSPSYGGEIGKGRRLAAYVEIKQ